MGGNGRILELRKNAKRRKGAKEREYLFEQTTYTRFIHKSLGII
jgi:hypothetical protein